MKPQYRVISLSDQGEERPSIVAEIADERWNGFYVPIMSFEDFIGHWKALADNDPNGDWTPYPHLSDDGVMRMLTIESEGADASVYLAEPDGRFRLDGLVWVDGDWSEEITTEMHHLGYEPPLECGCVPHRLIVTDRTPVFCLAEQQGYCNFECPHEPYDPHGGHKHRYYEEN